MALDAAAVRVLIRSFAIYRIKSHQVGYFPTLREPHSLLLPSLQMR